MVRTTAIPRLVIPYLASLVPDRRPILCNLSRLTWSDTVPNRDDLLYFLPKSLTHLTLRVWDKERWLLASPHYIEFRDRVGATADSTGYSAWMDRLRPKLAVLSPYLEVFAVESVDSVFGNAKIEDYFESLHRIPVASRRDGKVVSTSLPVSDH